MANCEDHWHSMEDKLTPGLMVKLFEFLIMKIYSSQCSLLAEKSQMSNKEDFNNFKAVTEKSRHFQPVNLSLSRMNTKLF